MVLANYLQLIGISLDFIGVIWLFCYVFKPPQPLKTKKMHIDIDIERQAFVMDGDMNDKEYTRKVVNELVKSFNDIISDMTIQLNSHKKVSNFSAYFIVGGFFFQLIGLCIQIYA